MSPEFSDFTWSWSGLRLKNFVVLRPTVSGSWIPDADLNLGEIVKLALKIKTISN